MLRNRTYLGQVHFRGTWSEASHPPLQRLGLPHLLTGLVVCGGCGRHFTGTRATGRNSTYRYYTCGGRQRYGSKTCDADRLPTDALDNAVVRSLLAAYEDTDLFTTAVAEAQGRAQLGRAATKVSCPPSMPNWPRSRQQSTATSGPSRPEPCPRASAASESKNWVTGRRSCERVVRT